MCQQSTFRVTEKAYQKQRSFLATLIIYFLHPLTWDLRPLGP